MKSLLSSQNGPVKMQIVCCESWVQGPKARLLDLTGSCLPFWPHLLLLLSFLTSSLVTWKILLPAFPPPVRKAWASFTAAAAPMMPLGVTKRALWPLLSLCPTTSRAHCVLTLLPVLSPKLPVSLFAMIPVERILLSLIHCKWLTGELVGSKEQRNQSYQVSQTCLFRRFHHSLRTSGWGTKKNNI